MATTDPRVDAYIAKSAEFAQPILAHIRNLVHDACPEVVETMKWSFPHFDYKGMMCSMASFKQHSAMGFWKWQLMSASKGAKADEAMGSFGRITSLADLPPDKTLRALVKEAMKLNETGAKTPRPEPKPRPKLVVPEYLRAALGKNKAAKKAFDRFSDSSKKEYVEWITEAKTEATRERRLLTAIEWIAEGKTRNWKYANC